MDRVRYLLNKVRKKRLSVKDAYNLFKNLPYENLGFARLDNHRVMRKGFPEVVYAEGKDTRHIIAISKKLISHNAFVLITRANKDIFDKLRRIYPDIKFDEPCRLIYLDRRKKRPKKGFVLIITAGTSDIPVACEARLTAELMGSRTKLITDVGVAGIHRIIDKMGELNKARAVIVVAGMEGALASVVSGLTKRPVVAVPTSVGYGASFKGIAPLLAMLNSCSPGVAVCNIDNGFGAGYFAALVNNNT